MSPRKWLAVAAALAALVPGCADASQLAPGTTAAADASADDEDTTGAGSDASTSDRPDEDGPHDGRWLWVFDDPPTYDVEGIRLTVTGMGITDATHEGAVPDDIASFLDEEVRTVVVFEIEVQNESDITASVFPNLARLHLGEERSTAKPLLSDTIGRELEPGQHDAGVVLWTLRRPYEEVLADGAMLLDASPPIDAATRNPLGDPIALTVAWDPPTLEGSGSTP